MTVLEIESVGMKELRHATVTVTVTVTDGSVIVDAAPTGTAENAETIMGALGVAIATVDPAAAPAERAEILAELGLQVNAASAIAIHASVEHAGVRYGLEYQPGEGIHFAAGTEW